MNNMVVLFEKFFTFFHIKQPAGIPVGCYLFIISFFAFLSVKYPALLKHIQVSNNGIFRKQRRCSAGVKINNRAAFFDFSAADIIHHAMKGSVKIPSVLAR